MESLLNLKRCLIFLAAWLACAVFLSSSAAAIEKPLLLLIQPNFKGDVLQRMYMPLAERLSTATGRQVLIITRPNFLAHWETVRRNQGFDLVIDDAHFTDYRVLKFGFHVIAKLPGTVSYSLVIAPGKRVVDPLELAGKPLASFGPPSIGATRLNAIFTNPSRRPAIVDIPSAADGVDLLMRGKVVAAMLPTSAVSEEVNRGTLRVITTTEPTPQMAFSISPRINEALAEKIRAVLLDVNSTKKDRPVPGANSVDRFEPATNEMYANQARILKTYWGY